MKSPVWHDEGLQRTNPVHVFEQIRDDLDGAFVSDWNGAACQLGHAVEAMAQAGGLVPAFALADRKPYLPPGFSLAATPSRPGVLGLVAQSGTDLGLVLPLRCEYSPSGWHIDDWLPFRPSALVEALVRLVRAAGRETERVLPERLAFAIGNPLGQRVVGNSMTVAAVLAVVDALQGRQSERLRCACALVEPDEEDLLRPVDHIKSKLPAVLREQGRGSLLVCTPGCEDAARFFPHFDQVWQVSTFTELAQRLHEAELLTPLLRQAPLRREELQRIHDHLYWLVQSAHDYHAASNLGQRLEVSKPLNDVALAEPVPAVLWSTVQGLAAKAWRHQGRFVEANAAGRNIHLEVYECGDFASYDERAHADAEYAAALFDSHRFAEVVPLLEPWLPILREDPKKLAPQTRVEVLNTLGRACILLGQDGWQDLFGQSRRLQERTDPGSVHRTLCYLIRGFLRRGLLDEARRELEALGPVDAIPGPSGWDLRFLRADLARRTGEQWQEEEMERARPGQQRPGHFFACYSQATARQPGRPDARERLERAAAFLRDEGRGHPHNITSLFANAVELYAAGLAGQPGAWAEAAAALRAFLDAPRAAPLRACYAPALDALPAEPSRAAADNFLSLIPYF